MVYFVTISIFLLRPGLDVLQGFAAGIADLPSELANGFRNYANDFA